MEKSTIVCLVMATLLEAKPFIDGMSLIRESEKPFPVYRNNNYILIISGIGKANAAMACIFCCLKFNECRIINLGAAGSTGAKYCLGENMHIIKAIEHDRPHLKSKSPYIYTPDFFEEFSFAKIATSDHPVIEPEERNKISSIADLVDMESASVIQACKKFDAPCYIFKFVSDTPEHRNDMDIVDNIKKYRNNFFEFFKKSVMPLL